MGRPLIMSPLMEEATDHFARCLSVTSSLVDLNLSKCSMLDRGLMLLANGLLRAKGRTGLRTLRLGANSLRLIDTDCVTSLSELLAAPFCSLTALELNDNPLHDIGALVLAEILQASLHHTIACAPSLLCDFCLRLAEAAPPVGSPALPGALRSSCAAIRGVPPSSRSVRRPTHR